MASGTGTATLDFGTHPGSNESLVSVTGISTISSTSKVEAFVMVDTSVDHTMGDHMYFNLFAKVTCIPVNGVGLNIYATSLEKLTGKFTVRYVWAD